MIPDNIKLLALITSNVPFTYIDNVVAADYSKYVELDEIQALIDTLKSDIEKVKQTTNDDVQIRTYTDEIYFLEKLMQDLGAK